MIRAQLEEQRPESDKQQHVERIVVIGPELCQVPAAK